MWEVFTEFFFWCAFVACETYFVQTRPRNWAHKRGDDANAELNSQRRLLIPVLLSLPADGFVRDGRDVDDFHCWVIVLFWKTKNLLTKKICGVSDQQELKRWPAHLYHVFRDLFKVI